MPSKKWNRNRNKNKNKNKNKKKMKKNKSPQEQQMAALFWPLLRLHRFMNFMELTTTATTTATTKQIKFQSQSALLHWILHPAAQHSPRFFFRFHPQPIDQSPICPVSITKFNEITKNFNLFKSNSIDMCPNNRPTVSSNFPIFDRSISPNWDQSKNWMKYSLTIFTNFGAHQHPIYHIGAYEKSPIHPERVKPKSPNQLT